MKLDKAIEISQAYHDCYSKYMDSKEGDALKVLIEAGKRVLDQRYSSWRSRRPLLPGETEE